MAVLTFCLVACAFYLINELDGNSEPCMSAKHNNAHKVFLRRHIPEGVPRTWDQNAWEAFLRKIKTCNRPTQSFFRSSERERVDEVCTKYGGKVLSGNLCISKEKFSFVTVRVNIDEGACGIRTIQNETKHIILACDEIGDVCQPVHFEGNPKATLPSNNAPDCWAHSGGSSGFQVALQEVFLVVVSVVMICSFNAADYINQF
ncbi:uncharacterized protein LOC113570687 [Electrophorus electricus]|uniref:uncharacterized protein LOC113570687 n=1 Tax=Electrophorus electricus TaxID=8005 RepID=UPI0015D08DBF|nr:uncharacterized protein LOC113570687 [Electrophorus electricus]XP_026855054.2 uncharacterized protein LOC113570687 [Electrophorus electricus]